MKITFTAIVNKIMVVIFFLLLILIVLQVILKVTGHSPITEIVLSGTLGLVISYIIFVTNKFYHFIGEMTEFKETTKESFKRIREDFKLVRGDISRINSKIDILSSKLDKIVR